MTPESCENDVVLGSGAGDHLEELGSSAINGRIVRLPMDGEAHEG